MITKSLAKLILSFLERDEEELNYIIEHVAQFRCADKELVEMMLSHLHLLFIKNMDLWHEKVNAETTFAHQYSHHVKAITMASLIHNQLDMHHPDLMKSLLTMNAHIPESVLDDMLRESESKASGDLTTT